LLEGKNVDLKLVEKEDTPLLQEWHNNPEFSGEYVPMTQASKAEMEKSFDRPSRPKNFFIQKKDGIKVGLVVSWEVAPNSPDLFGLEIGYSLLPGERKKGYCAEALNLLLDYLFLSTTAVRIQAHTDARNLGSQRVLEKAGFKKEGTIRKSMFVRGDWRDFLVYSILRDEWKAPRILKGTS
jgi:[ribosomal protein S5]-alanine N-acetyltransferase